MKKAFILLLTLLTVVAVGMAQAPAANNGGAAPAVNPDGTAAVPAAGAQPAGNGAAGGLRGLGGNQSLIMILMFVGIMVIWYFLLIRPQQKKEKDRQKLINELKKGDKVVTIGGIHGTVVNVTDKTVTVKVDSNTNIEFSKAAISNVPSMETPGK